MTITIGQRITYTNDHGETKTGAVFCLLETLAGPTDIILVKPDNCGSMLETARITDVLPADSATEAPGKTGGVKWDGGKPRHSLIPDGTTDEVVAVLEHGAAKYGADNWKRVPNARTRYYDALMRHVAAWWHGQTNDPETGKHHLASAICCAMFLIWLDRKGASE